MFEHGEFRPLWPVIFLLPWLLLGSASLLKALRQLRNRAPAIPRVSRLHWRVMPKESRRPQSLLQLPKARLGVRRRIAPLERTLREIVRPLGERTLRSIKLTGDVQSEVTQL